MQIYHLPNTVQFLGLAEVAGIALLTQYAVLDAHLAGQKFYTLLLSPKGTHRKFKAGLRKEF